MSYPAIAFLTSQDFANKRILEFGAGYSTMWWGSRASTILSLESDDNWYRFLKDRLPSNVVLQKATASLEDWPQVGDGQFDIIVIDGMDRFACAKRAKSLLAHDGAIILDDSQQPWDPTGNGRFVILDLFRSQGFRRIDFIGYAPAVLKQHCTSIFFREDCFLFSGDAVPRI
jgi:hypothetical protein